MQSSRSNARHSIISETIASHQASVGAHADWGYADTDDLRVRCDLPDSIDGWGTLISSVVSALHSDFAREARTAADARWWCQLVNRLTDRLVMHPEARMGTCFGVIDRVVASLAELAPPARISDGEWRCVERDLLGSIAGAAAWGLFASHWRDEPAAGGLLDANEDRRGIWVARFVESATLNEYIKLYALRFRLRPHEIRKCLRGQHYRSRDHVKAGFGFFASALLGDWSTAVDDVRWFVEREATPLVLAKLVSTSLHYSPPPRLDGEPAATMQRILKDATDVWESVGGDSIALTASAELAAMQGDTARLNEKMDQAVRLVESRSAPTFDDFESLAMARLRLMERVTLQRELAQIEQAKRDAEEALQMAHSAAAQAPTVVGIFTAVIALVIGTSQVAQGLQFKERVLVVAALGVVLLGFVGCLAIILNHRPGRRHGFATPVVGAGLVTAAVSALLVLVVNLA